METILKKAINVSPSSDEGHYVHDAQRVIDLDNVTESFYVEGGGKLKTKNHTTLNLDETCMITCQMVYNPFSKMLEKSKD